MGNGKSYDVAVVGAGVFGAWTAWHLTKRGQRVILLDTYGPAHSRASSGGETRIIRMGYGADEIYTRWAQRSLPQWEAFFEENRLNFFHQTGVLWLAGKDSKRLHETAATLKRCQVEHERLNLSALEKRYPQINFAGVTEGLLEPHSGVLMARRSVAAIVKHCVLHGAEYTYGHVDAPFEEKRLHSIVSSNGGKVSAGHFVFACGPWLGKLFPRILEERLSPSRQEVFFFGVPAGDTSYSPPEMPSFLFQQDEMYGMPDIEHRGLKIACDRHGGKIDPDTQSRIVCEKEASEIQNYVAHRFPTLKNAPIVETRVCQYENTSSGDFLVDRHPEMENVWLAGGGSGHGFKHGPALGEYLAGQILDAAPAEPRFLLANKQRVQQRSVY